MTLEELISTLKTSNVVCTIYDLEDTELAKVYASSYDVLDSTILARVIKTWKIASSTSLNIVLEDEESA